MYKLNIRLRQTAKLPVKKDIDTQSDWIAVFSQQAGSAAGKKLPYSALLLERRAQLGNKRADTEPLTTNLPNKPGTYVSYVAINADISAFELLTLSRKLFAAQQKNKPKSLTITIVGFNEADSERIIEALLSAVYAANAQMPNYKSKQDKGGKLREISLYGLELAHAFKRSLYEAQGNMLARYLSQLPPNELTPSSYLEIVNKLAQEQAWNLRFYDEKALLKMNAGAFLAVCQGSADRDAGIIRLTYQAPGQKHRRKNKKLCLVGKGICYDTGGNNLKPAKYMYGMHEDMQGSAVALGTFLALSQQKVDFDMECWLALAMNHIGPKAYKPNDVIKALNGTSIEVIHTDAEGRMVLADTLALACKEKPDLMIDYATLTGACVYSLGSAYSGVFTNQQEFIPTLIASGKDTGERIWPFPMDADYDKALESQIADVKQCALEGEADHILAARFLQRFVKPGTPWIHVDLSSGNKKGGLAHIATDTTGFGVRLTNHLLLDKGLLN